MATALACFHKCLLGHNNTLADIYSVGKAEGPVCLHSPGKAGQSVILHALMERQLVPPRVCSQTGQPNVPAAVVNHALAQSSWNFLSHQLQIIDVIATATNYTSGVSALAVYVTTHSILTFSLPTSVTIIV